MELVAYLMKRQMRQAWKQDQKRRKKKGTKTTMMRHVTPAEAELLDAIKEWSENACSHVVHIDPVTACALGLALTNLVAHGMTVGEAIREMSGGIPADSMPIPFVISSEINPN